MRVHLKDVMAQESTVTVPTSLERHKESERTDLK